MSKPMALVALLVLVGATSFGWWSLSRQVADMGFGMCAHADYAPPSLVGHIREFCTAETLPERRLEILAIISKSEDPIAYALLLSVADDPLSVELRSSARKRIVERIERKGLALTAAAVSRWFTVQEQNKRDPSRLKPFQAILQACDPLQSDERRVAAVNETYGIEKVMGLQLAGSLAIDDREKFLPVLRDLVQREGATSDASNAGVVSLLLSNRTLFVFYRDDVIKLIDELSDKELVAALLAQAESEDPILQMLQQKVVERKLLNVYQMAIVKIWERSQRRVVTDGVQGSLIRAAVDRMNTEDVSKLARWGSNEAEMLLYAVCASTQNVQMRQLAFDALAGRSLSVQPAGNLVKLVRGDHWDERTRAIRPLGVVGQYLVSSPADLDQALTVLSEFLGEPLVMTILDSQNDVVLQSALRTLKGAFHTPDLLRMLDHRDKKVRLMAVTALKGENDLNALQLIARAYERERDGEVRESYRELHWVVGSSAKGK